MKYPLSPSPSPLAPLSPHSPPPSLPSLALLLLIVFQGGIKVLPTIINAVILIAVLSVGNSSTYASSRTVAALAGVGQAPKIFGYIDRQ